MQTFLRVILGLVLLGAMALVLFIFWPLKRTSPEQLVLEQDSMAWPDVPEADYPHLAAIAADCAACHTASDGAPFAGNRPFETPFGTIYSANITPDRATGIGGYSLDQFRAALVDGIRGDGAHLYPAMPYASFRKLGERDIEALYTYFTEEVEPVRASVSKPDMTFPFNLRFGIRAWKWLAMPEPGFVPPEDPVLARGAYLVEGPEHCGACHTERNLLYIEKGYSAADPDFLMGGALNGWPAPALRGENGAPARWSAENLKAYLRDGRNDHNATAGEMTLVIEHSLQHLPESDIDAIVAYLRSLAPNGGGGEPPPPAATDAERLWVAMETNETTAMLARADPEELDLGARLYLDNCSACHMVDGKGAPGVFPELDDNPVITDAALGGLLQMILHGDEMPSTSGAPLRLAMPGFHERLNNHEIAALASFVRNAWSNRADEVSASDVAEARDSK